MQWQEAPFLFALAVAGTVAVVAMLLAWRQRAAAGGLALAGISAAVAVWAFGYIFELAHTSLDTVLFWAKVEYLGIVSMPVFWLIFALHYTHRMVIRGWRWAALAGIPLITLLLVWTNERHGLIWASTRMALDPEHTSLHLQVVYGSWFWVHIAYSYLCLLAGSVLFFLPFHQAGRLRRNSRSVLLAVFVAWLGNVLFLAGLSPWPELDITPLTFSLSGLLITYELYRHHLLDIVPMAGGALIERMSDGLILLDNRDRVVDANQVALAGLDRPKTAVIGVPIATLLEQWSYQLDDIAPSDDQPHELLVRSNGQQRVVDVRITPLHDQYGALVGRLIVWRDSTARKRTEQELQRKNQELAALAAENQRLYAEAQAEIAVRTQTEQALLIAKDAAETANRARSTFLAMMSHELRTPLNAVLGYSELLQMRLEDSGQTHLLADVDTIWRSGQHLLEIVNHVLHMASIGSGKLDFFAHPFDVEAMLSELIGVYEPQIQANGNTFTFTAAGTLGRVVGDEQKLRQVLANLLSNAGKFTANGHVTLNAERHMMFDSDWLVFQINDTGIGIPHEYQANLFSDFSQADSSTARRYGGVGLGLAISYHFCTIMGGRIVISSEPDNGTRCTVYVPIGAQAAPAHGNSVASVPGATAS